MRVRFWVGLHLIPGTKFSLFRHSETARAMSAVSQQQALKAAPNLQPFYSIHPLDMHALELIQTVAKISSKDSSCTACRDAAANRAALQVKPRVRAGLTADGTLPQPRCDGSISPDRSQLSAPPFAAAERPRRLIEEHAPFGLRMSGKPERQNIATVKRYLRNATQPLVCRFRTCAVVGSAGRLRGSRLGRAIDAADAIFRVNAAPTRKHEADVGARTTWRVHNSEKPFFMAALDVPELNLVICHNRWIGACQHQAYGGVYAERTAAINPRFYSELWSLVKQGRRKSTKQQVPSTGLLAIALGLSVCDNVTVYGFSRPSDPQARCSRHYWECPKWAERERYLDPKHEFHDWLGEVALRERWIRDGLITDGLNRNRPER